MFSLAISFFGPPHYLGWILLLLLLLGALAWFLFFRGVDDEPVQKPARLKPEPAKPTEAAEKSEPVPAEPQPIAPPDLKGTRKDEKLGLIFDEAPEDPDDLTQIKGVGPVIWQKLNDFGVYRFEQIAGWDEKTVSEFSERLSFPDRVNREKWVEQAQKLVEKRDA